MPVSPEILQLIKQAQLDFVSQNLDIVHLALDKVTLGAQPYTQPYEVDVATGSTETNTYSIPTGQLWVLSKVVHRDVEPGIFTVTLRVDNVDLFPANRLENAHFLLPLAKAFICTKNFKTVVYNNDTVTKTYRHLRIWHIYDKVAVNSFLSLIGAPTIQ